MQRDGMCDARQKALAGLTTPRWRPGTRDEMLTRPLLLTLAQAADRLQISKASLYREVRRGKLPIVKVGHLTRVRIEDLIAYVSALASPAA